ncbi:hypothetical protein H2200_013461 [Cladophialophora chaetospira]|uniref:Uncharacterized protein n=1 Tax=Cladophialophora chaetospira TaxID=386627 RepID=A0AA38U7V7_9EURO|nr:hypothetical protein H2200_013461 [Cladophialophora chaetospira]
MGTSALLALLLSVVVQSAMEDYDPDISNGTCYYSNGNEANSRYLPCGNAALGHKTCCESLDKYGVTYLAGCTDQSYDDAACPTKIGPDGNLQMQEQQWVGLVYCNGTSNEWVACDEREVNSDTVTTPSYCWCPDDDSRTAAFSASSVLKDLMALPATAGLNVSWEDADAWTSEHTLASSLNSASSTGASGGGSLPSTSSSLSSPTPTSQGTSSSSAPSTSVPTFAAPVATSASTHDSGMSTGAKAGIAVGAIVGAAILGFLAWLFYACLRRRSQEHLAKAEEPPPMQEPTLPHVDRDPINPEMRSPAWSGHKSELPADESMTSMSASPTPGYHEYAHQRPDSMTRSEVEGSVVKMSPTRPMQDGGLVVPGQKGTFYEMAG